MGHGSTVVIDINEVINAEPIKPSVKLSRAMLLFLVIGAATFGYGLIYVDHALLWGAYYVNLVFFMGLAAGSVALTAIFQIVRAKWSSPVSRIAEAPVAFLPWAFVLWACTYFGRGHLFPWANHPMPGKELWMSPDFVYGRFTVLLALLFFMMHRFVKFNLRADIGFLREKSKNQKLWGAYQYDALNAGWKGSEKEIAEIQPKRSWNAPLLIALYAVIYSLFAFEMVMAMDPIWYANMYGGFVFIGNIYLAWAVLGITVVYLMKQSTTYARCVHADQFWDMGKMTFAFCMLWGYMFWAQYLPQWYGNLPEETQWMILRTKEFPWKGLAWIVFPMCFIIPFITLLSRDVKRTPKFFVKICILIFFGIWLEKYITIMPQLSPDRIPLSCVEVGLFLGFLGAYVLSVQNFLARYPFVQVSHPATVGKTDW